MRSPAPGPPATITATTVIDANRLIERLSGELLPALYWLLLEVPSQRSGQQSRQEESHSLHDGNDEVALIIRAGGLIAVGDLTCNAIRIYNQHARQVGMVTMSCDHPPL